VLHGVAERPVAVPGKSNLPPDIWLSGTLPADL
jgi:hypothetical protein